MIRTAEVKDAEKIISLIESVYNWGTKNNINQWKKWKTYVEKNCRNHRILEENGELLGICYSAWRNLFFFDDSLRICDISEICVRNDLRLKGLGTILLEDTLALMKKNDIDLSRLHYRNIGSIKFYNGLGYKLFPNRWVELSTDIEKWKTPENVRLYDMNKDFDACRSLYNHFNKKYVCSLIWEKDQGNWNNKNRIVYEKDNAIIGYLYADENFGNIAYAREQPKVLIDLIIWSLINNKNAEPLKIKLPIDTEIIGHLKDAKIKYKFVEVCDENSHNMLQIIDNKKIDKKKSEFEFFEDNNNIRLIVRNCILTGGSELWGSDNLNTTKFSLKE